MNKNTRRYLTFGSTALISIGAVALILINTTGAAGQAAEPVSSAPTSTEAEVSVPEIKVASQEPKSGSASAFIPSNGASAAASLTTISKPTSTPPKPTPPASSALTDKSKRPSYSSKPTAPQKTTTKKVTSTPKNGEVKDGKTWMDGFGWVEGTGGGEGTVVSGMHEGGEQVGIMD